MVGPMQQSDTIQVLGRGTGVDITIDDTVPFEFAERSLLEYLEVCRGLYSRGAVSVNVGRRILVPEQLAAIKAILDRETGLTVTRYWCAPQILEKALLEKALLEHGSPPSRGSLPVSGDMSSQFSTGAGFNSRPAPAETGPETGSRPSHAPPPAAANAQGRQLPLAMPGLVTPFAQAPQPPAQLSPHPVASVPEPLRPAALDESGDEIGDENGIDALAEARCGANLENLAPDELSGNQVEAPHPPATGTATGTATGPAPAIAGPAARRDLALSNGESAGITGEVLNSLEKSAAADPPGQELGRELGQEVGEEFIGPPLRLNSIAPSPQGPASPASPATRNHALFIKATCRSGEVVHYFGDVVVFGDVNPGAEIIAGGDVVVLGALRGMVQAGAYGDPTATIFALNLESQRLQIGSHVGEAPARLKTARSGTRPVTPRIAYLRRRSIFVAPFDRRRQNYDDYQGGILYEG